MVYVVKKEKFGILYKYFDEWFFFYVKGFCLYIVLKLVVFV